MFVSGSKIDHLQVGTLIRWQWGNTNRKQMFAIVTSVNKRGDTVNDEYTLHLFNGDDSFNMLFYHHQLEETTSKLTVISQ